MIFDLFGVIAKHQPEAARERLEEIAGVAGERFWSAYWALRPPYDRGDLSGVAYWRFVAEALDRSFSLQQADELVEADLDSWSEIDGEMVAFLAELRERKVRLGLLSNITQELAVRYQASQQWLELFDVVGFSCMIGHAKPSPEAYLWCTQRLGVAPENVIFVDDRQGNVDAATALGMRGHLFTSLAGLRTSYARITGAT